MATSLPPCSFGSNQSECHLNQFCRKQGFVKISNLDSKTRELLKLRTENEVDLDGHDGSLCLHHEQLLINKYEFLQKSCVDPFQRHKKKPAHKKLKPLTPQHVADLKTLHGISVKPGQKLCPNCMQQLKTIQEPIASPLGQYKHDEAKDQDDEFMDCAHEEEILNDSITHLGISPMKSTRVSSQNKARYGKRKIDQVQEAVIGKVASALELSKSALDISHLSQTSTCKKCDDMDHLLYLIKEKMKISSKQRKIQLLTLAPRSWSIARTATEFNVSEYKVRQARKLKDEKGILAEPQANAGKPLSKDVEERVRAFYQDDEYTRLLPGAKDFKSVIGEDGKRQHMQKRLILMNLNELYENYKMKYSSDKIGLSKFCSLRPENCITVGSKGTHSVCVCSIHQNVKLMVSALPTNAGVTVHDLIDKLVCSVDSKMCMVHQCPNCPGADAVIAYLETLCEADDSTKDIVYFKQWISTDSTTLQDCNKPLHQFLEFLTEKLEKLTPHHYISKSQSAYLSELKENLREDEAILILDFAENYSFIVQDAVQGFHWENSQATLHPFVAYIKQEGQTQHLCMCVISDTLKHDTIAVNRFQHDILNYMKQECPELKKIYYFSDGAASQYKNFKNFTNLMYHEEDFGMCAEWHFFATSHGKNACDGVGGTVKREAAKASLQAITSGHILTPKDLYNWSVEHIKNVTFFFVNKEEVLLHASSQKERFSSATTVAGTRDFHCFIPSQHRKLTLKRFSKDNSAIQVSIFSSEEATLRLPNYDIGQYIGCNYDGKWWVGYIKDKSEEVGDLYVKFMHPHGPARSFYWPSREDVCWVPQQCILRTINVPNTSNGRQYHLDAADKAFLSKA